MDLVYDTLIEVQHQIDGGVAFLECEDGEKLIRFYESDTNSFRCFGESFGKRSCKVHTVAAFSVERLRRFYQTYQIQQTVSAKLLWSHYCELLTISDADKRSLYEKEAINSGWSIQELNR